MAATPYPIVTETVRRPATEEELRFELFLRQRMNELYWQTKDGRKISLVALSDLHLKRIIAMLDRNRTEIEHLEDSAILNKDYYA